jgi:hypothetical protein
MTWFKKYFLSFACIFSCALLVAQENTRTTDTRSDRLTGKILLVPYESKMYMSEIDAKVNQQTKWQFNQINEFFRHQLDSQLKLKLQSVASPVVTFYVDSVKTSKDLDYIYKSTAISFDKPDKITAPTAA